MVQFIRNNHYSTIYIHFPTLIRQLGNEQVVIKKLPPIKKKIKSTSDNVEIQDGKSKVEKLQDCNVLEPSAPPDQQQHAKEQVNKVEDNNFDDIFFQEFNKKMPMRISKAYCSRCDKTIEDEKFKDRYCPECFKMLSYKCLCCNLQFALYNSLIYHLQNSCNLDSTDSSSYTFEDKNNKATTEHTSPTISDSMNKNTINAENKSSAENFTISNDTPTSTDSETLEIPKSPPKNIVILNDTLIKENNKVIIKQKSPLKNVPMSTDTTTVKDDVIIKSKSSEKSIPMSNNLEINNNRIKLLKKNVEQPVENNPPIEESKPSTSFDSSNDTKNLDDSFKAENNEIKYSVIPIQKKSSVLRKICTPCDNKIFDLKVIHCNNCKKVLTSQCIRCSKLFNFSQDTANHLELCNPVSSYCCSNCEYKTKVSHFMKEHIKSKCKFLLKNNSATAKKKVICEKCNQSFVNEESFKVHQKYCAPLKCDYCPYKTKHKASLTTHLKRHAKIKKIENGTTSRVSVNYKLKHSAATDISSKIKEYCPQCGDVENFDYKKKRVGCSKCKMMLKWKCQICDKLYNSSTSVMHHVKTHHAEEHKTIECTNCHKEFVSFLKMKLHTKLCTAQVGAECEYCDFKTKNSHKMKEHYNEKHGDLPLNKRIFK